MRLIDTTTLELHEFYSDFPEYAILSHTWGDDEVPFHEMSLPTRSSRKGFNKIAKTCELARGHYLNYAWVDTCCIDKSSSAELTESINSMYRWYSDAVVCYVILEDLPVNGDAEVSLAGCRWFSRGWTLQVLIASKVVQFFDAGWYYRGSKTDFLKSISSCTRIQTDVLQGDKSPKEYSIAERMSWAASRETTQLEDMAYCLLGIFDVNMPLLYGEGGKAFRRLQEEIIKRNNDLTIFAWETPQEYKEAFLGILASSPDLFDNVNNIRPFDDSFIDFSITNKGLSVSGDALVRAISRVLDNENSMYCLYLGVSDTSICRGIYLRKIGPALFCRDGRLPLASIRNKEVEQFENLDGADYFILAGQLLNDGVNSLCSAFRNGALYVAPHESLTVVDAVPQTLWDITDRTFLKPKPYSWSVYPMVLAIDFVGYIQGNFVQVVVFCDYRESSSPSCKLFWKGQFLRQESLVFQGRNEGRHRNETVFWTTLETEAPHILGIGSKLEKRNGDEVIGISAHLERVAVEGVSPEMSILKLDVSCSRIRKQEREKHKVLTSFLSVPDMRFLPARVGSFG